MEAIKTTCKHGNIGPLSKHGQLNPKIPRQTSSATTSRLAQAEMGIMMCKHETRLPLKCPKTTVTLFHFLLTSRSGSYCTGQKWSFSELIDSHFKDVNDIFRETADHECDICRYTCFTLSTYPLPVILIKHHWLYVHVAMNSVHLFQQGQHTVEWLRPWESNALAWYASLHESSPLSFITRRIPGNKLLCSCLLWWRNAVQLCSQYFLQTKIELCVKINWLLLAFSLGLMEIIKKKK